MIPTVRPSRDAGDRSFSEASAISPPSGRWAIAITASASWPRAIWVATSLPSARPKDARPAAISDSVDDVDDGGITRRSTFSSR